MLEDFHARKAAEDESSAAKTVHALFENAYDLPKPGLTKVAANDLADWTKDPINSGMLNGILAPVWPRRESVGGGLKRYLKPGS